MNAPRGEETIFVEALRLPADERAAYVAQATAGNPQLRQEVESLLHGYATGDFLEAAAASELRPTLHATVPVIEKPGDTIGRYKLLQQIGEGGCGVVYMAEQSEPVRRRVALKIIKLGMDTRSVIARFEAERQALALMDHPNIAKVFDAGATETGRPYFVMELVRGVKITEFCDEKKLPTKQRLDLFVQVCQAIQHAHQKGIIHRDIKPSNILVSVNDGVAVSKVIDFGIAKATSGQQLTDKTLFTAFEQFIGTPAYMSPEQAMITNVDIDTRSDIYALGVLLYELLTGKTPFDAKELLAIGLDEMRRTIREQEPQRPSTCLSTLPGQELSTTAQRRGLDAPKLVSELRGDLDWIVMKALEKDRARRYETANGLAADIQRHLNNEPVVACPPSSIYQVRKAFRRNQLAFSTAAAIVTALAIGLGVSMWRFAKERQALKRAVAAEQAAKEEKDSAEAVLKFVRDKILAAGRPEGMGGGAGKDISLREAIEQAESQIIKAFTNRPLVEAAMRKTLGESYLHLDEPALAIPQLETALAVRREKLGLENEHTVGTLTLLRKACKAAGRPFEFLPFYEKAFALAKAKWGPDHTNTFSVMSELADARKDAGQRDEAIQLYEELIQLRTTKLGTDREVLFYMGNLAGTCQETKRFDDAISLLERALKLWTAQSGPEDERTLICMNNLATAYHDAKKFDRAVSVYEQALEVKKRSQPTHHETLVTMSNLAWAYRDLGKLDEAISLFKETLQLRMATLGPRHAETLRVMTGLAGTYLDAKRFDDGFPLYEKALELRTATLGRTNRLTLNLMNELGFAYGYDTSGKQLGKATPLFEETLTLRRAVLGSNHVDTVVTMDNLARDYAWAGRFDEAASLLHEIQSIQGIDHPRTLYLMNSIAVFFSRAGKLDQVLALWEQAFTRAKATLGIEHTSTQLYLKNLARGYRDTGKADQVEALYREHLSKQNTNAQAVRVEVGRLWLETSSRGEVVGAREDEPLVRDYLAAVRSHYTNDPLKLAERLYDVAELRYRQHNYAEAELLYREIAELRKATLGAEHKDTLDGMASLARVLSDWAWAERSAKSETRNPKSEVAERAREAERLLREVLAMRFRDSTNSWRIGEVKSRLGGALVCATVTDSTMDAQSRDARFTDAESLLLGGYESLQIRSDNPKYVRDALERIERLYEAWNKPDKHAQWQQKTLAHDSVQLAQTATWLLQQKKFAEAESPARACVAIREKQMPDDWLTFNARSMVGGSLLGQKKHADAEPLLIAGYEGMKQRQGQIPAAGTHRIRESLERLVQLYQATGREVQVAEWKKKLAEFDQATNSKTQAQAK